MGSEMIGEIWTDTVEPNKEDIEVIWCLLI